MTSIDIAADSFTDKAGLLAASRPVAEKAPRQKSALSGMTKTEIVLKKLRTPRGATIAQLCEATGWQAHSVRGFLSAVVRKKLALALVCEQGKDGVRRYRIVGDA